MEREGESLRKRAQGKMKLIGIWTFRFLYQLVLNACCTQCLLKEGFLCEDSGPNLTCE